MKPLTSTTEAQENQQMNERTRWWLIRHAPVVGAQDLFYGGSDVAADVSDETMFAAFPAGCPTMPCG